MKKEIRNIEIRAVEGQSNKIEGYAAVYNSRSEWMGFYEVILPGAFDEVINNCDCVLVIDHDDSTILARCINGSGTLRLLTDETGLKFTADLDPQNPRAAYLISALQRGDIKQCSFAFADVADEWSQDEEGNDVRTISKVGYLCDVSAVVHPAYADTSVALRSLEKSKISEINIKNEAPDPDAERSARYQKMIDEIYE